MLPGLGVYDPRIGSLCSKIENHDHLSLACFPIYNPGVKKIRMLIGSKDLLFKEAINSNVCNIIVRDCLPSNLSRTKYIPFYAQIVS